MPTDLALLLVLVDLGHPVVLGALQALDLADLVLDVLAQLLVLAREILEVLGALVLHITIIIIITR